MPARSRSSYENAAVFRRTRPTGPFRRSRGPEGFFEFFEDTARQNPERQVGVDIGVFQKVCKPDADIPALAYRSMMLRLLAGPAPSKDLEPHWKDALAPWKHDRHLDAAVYREFAQLPMEWIGVGVIRQGPPFDVESLLRRLSGEAK